MLKKIAIIFSFVLFSFLFPKSAFAIENPLSTSNNIFGIHIHDENDLEDAARLINSSGGDWGYVTIVITKGDRNSAKWQSTFDRMRQLHVIPIIRIATQELNGGWEKGSIDEIPGWVDYLANLNWVIKNRYVIIGNEPNHAIEWGNDLNPEEYSDYLLTFAKALKEKNQDFFVLPAAMDASAPTNHVHLSSLSFLERMLKKNPNLFDYIDGWNSHSYPNPEFSGKAEDDDSVSIASFVHELNFIRNLGVTKNLPIFITETGWAHNQNEGKLRYVYASPQEIGKRYEYAFQNTWNKPNIVAVTPFIINYQSEPFSKFSWKDKEGNFYPFYETIIKIPKTKGNPTQTNTAQISAILLPDIFTKDNSKYGYAYAKNTGQTIWEVGEPQLVTDEEKSLILQPIYPQIIEPGHSGLTYFGKISALLFNSTYLASKMVK